VRNGSASDLESDSPLPTGTLTLLFSDVEGSTNLLRILGKDYAAMLSRQRAVLRAAFERWRGREIGTEGDSFFVVFASVVDAVHAAAQAQRDLADQDWPSGVQVSVRIGLHTGEPTRHEDDYVGMDVHRAARVAASAHGGQIVVSEATYRIAIAQLLDGMSFSDLGTHRLKDLPQPERLYQVTGTGLRLDFPALRTLGARASLPATADRLVGREGELRELRELVERDNVRLVTLTGPGGSGKTRLAIAAAAVLEPHFPAGVYFVALESVQTAEVMWTTIADVLGVTGEGRAPPTFLSYLAQRQILLVLDTLEAIPDAAAVVGELLATCQRIGVLATSRRPLHLVGEFEHPVPPLTLPAVADVESAAASGAVQLFVQRARMVRPDFALTAANATTIVEICRRLDGLPLALELTAARMKLLSPRAVLTRLDSSLALAGAGHGRPRRQRTLHETIDWSYTLLPQDLQHVFRQLAVFSGDFDLDAMATVIEAPVDPLECVAELVDGSLAAVTEGPDGEPRIRLLQTIAVFARARLSEHGDLEDACRRHARHFLAQAAATGPKLRTGQHLQARDWFELELDNLRAALLWCFGAEAAEGQLRADDVQIGLQLCEAMHWFWYACGYHSEGRRWLRTAVDRASGQDSPTLMIAVHGLGVLLLQRGDLDGSRAALERCLDYWRRVGDRGHIAAQLGSLAAVHRALGDNELARTMLADGIATAREVGDRARLANGLSNLAMLEIDEQRPDAAVELLHEALRLDKELDDPWGVACDHSNLAGALFRAGRVTEAYEHLHDNALAAVGLGDVELTITVLELFCMLLAELGRADAAARLLGAARTMRDDAELPIPAPDADVLERTLDKVRLLTDAEQWRRNTAIGAHYSLEDAMKEALGQPAGS